MHGVCTVPEEAARQRFANDVERFPPLLVTESTGMDVGFFNCDFGDVDHLLCAVAAPVGDGDAL